MAATQSNYWSNIIVRNIDKKLKPFEFFVHSLSAGLISVGDNFSFDTTAIVKELFDFGTIARCQWRGTVILSSEEARPILTNV